ncbi:MAG: energy transducer TonB [Burkholderiales bacterium]|nr:energy transducer TonB [Burkholderiales bacterium]
MSLTLHAALFFLPYLRNGASASRAAAQSRHKAAAPRLDATLTPEGRPALAQAEPPPAPADGGGVADAPADRVAGAERQPALDRGLGMGLLPIAAPAYYTTDQLSRRPRPTSEPELDTAETRPIIAAGTIILKLWIDERGDVIAVDIEKTELPELFSKTAAAAFRNLRFTPGELNGRHVGSLMRIEVTYGGGSLPP